MAKNNNRFNKNHPTINPEDPAVLLTAGLGMPQEPVQEEEEIDDTAPAQETAQEAPQAEKEQVRSEDAVFIPLDEIGLNQKPKKKTTSVYLSEDVLDELEKRAKKAKLKPSPYLDELLRRVFGL